MSHAVIKPATTASNPQTQGVGAVVYPRPLSVLFEIEFVGTKAQIKFHSASEAMLLFAHLVVPLRLHQLLLVFRRELRPVDGQCDLVDLAGEGERRLVVLVVNSRQRVRADVEALVPLQDQRQRALHLLCPRRPCRPP